MTRTRKTTLAAALCGSLLVFGLPAAWAGAEEDYAEGSKIYYSGDLIGSIPKLQQAANAGHAGAQALFASILEQADDRITAVTYYKKSAEQGNADGQFGYAALLSTGDGVDKNLVEARRWVQAAAKQGHRMAINEMALSYIRGDAEIPEAERNDTMALHWLKLSAESNFRPAMDAMVAAYQKGRYGLPVDAKAAAQWTDKINKLTGTRTTGRRNRSKE